MDVTDVLRDRMQEPAGLQATAVVSALVHAVALAAIVLLSGGLFGERARQPRSVMTISLGGGNGGPENGGMTSIGGRPVQAVIPPEEIKRPEPVRPPAARTPEMTLPKPGSGGDEGRPAPAVKQAPDEARGRTPTRGEETSAGSAVAETGARGQGFGLSTGGGVGSGSRLDVADFCCPDYLMLMVEKIRSNWNARAGSSRRGHGGIHDRARRPHRRSRPGNLERQRRARPQRDEGAGGDASTPPSAGRVPEPFADRSP